MGIPNIIGCEICDLIPVNPSNVLFLEELFQDPDVKKYYVLRKGHEANIRAFCNYVLAANRQGTGMNFIIYDNYGEEVGFISAEPILNNDTGMPMWNMGYAVIPTHRRMGFASTAVSGLTNYLLQHFSIPHVVLDISMDNVASENLAKKCGFTCPDERKAYIDWEHPEVGMRKKWFKQLAGKRTIFFNQAVQLYRMKAYAESIQKYKQALAEPYQQGTPFTDAQIYSNMGMALSSMGFYKEAYDALKKAQSMGLSNPSITKELLWLKTHCGLG